MQTKRSPSSVILDPGVLELVLNDARDFLSSKKWYADRGVSRAILPWLIPRSQFQVSRFAGVTCCTVLPVLERPR